MPEMKQYSYEEVKRILCEGCAKNIDEKYLRSKDCWIHLLNGVEVPCNANEWRLTEGRWHDDD